MRGSISANPIRNRFRENPINEQRMNCQPQMKSVLHGTAFVIQFYGRTLG